MSRAAAILVAAGSGTRMGPGAAKQYRLIGGRPMLVWSLAALAAAPEVGPIVLVHDGGGEAPSLAAAAGFRGLICVPGGATRTESVRAGLAALAGAAGEIVLIHDAARPGLTPAHIAALCAGLAEADACAPALPLADALKQVDPSALVIGEASREGLRRVQTPQAFRRAALEAAFAALPVGAALDDDLAVARAAGLRVRLIPGEHCLMKATHPEDLALLEALLSPPVPRVGFGFDAHRFGPGDHVTLCGLAIPHSAGLIGHSDADAGWHALTDALLGAMGLGDIGDHFPPSDPQWRGAASEIFLAYAAGLVAKGGGRIVNVDLTLICERPKIKPHREAMRARTAEVLRLPIERVSVKATTTEAMGFTGREEGLAAQAAVSVLCPGGMSDV